MKLVQNNEEKTTGRSGVFKTPLDTFKNFNEKASKSLITASSEINSYPPPNAVNLRIYSNSPNFFFDIYIHT